MLKKSGIGTSRQVLLMHLLNMDVVLCSSGEKKDIIFFENKMIIFQIGCVYQNQLKLPQSNQVEQLVYFLVSHLDHIIHTQNITLDGFELRKIQIWFPILRKSGL